MIKFLVPVIFTDYSLHAVHYALTLAGKFPAEVTLLHCFGDYLPREAEEEGERSDNKHLENLENQEQAARLRLEQFREENSAHLRAGQQLSLQCRFEYGYPEDLIPKISTKERFDVVVMGTKTKGETIKETLGSISGDVIRKSTVPVLAVPAQAAAHPESLSRILFLLERNDRDYLSLHHLIRLVSAFPTEIYAVLYCKTRADKNDIRRMDQLRSYCDSTYHHVKINFDIITGRNYIESLESYLAENPADLLAMTRQKRKSLSKLFSPSITRQLLFRTDQPLLVFQK